MKEKKFFAKLLKIYKLSDDHTYDKDEEKLKEEAIKEIKKNKKSHIEFKDGVVRLVDWYGNKKMF